MLGGSAIASTGGPFIGANADADLGLIHDRFLGRGPKAGREFRVQAHWRGLTDSVIRVYVAGGPQPDYLRVRILKPYTIYLPLVLRN